MEDRKTFVQQRIHEEMPREAIRRELISHGFSTEGFEGEYAQLLKDSGKTEPAPEKPQMTQPATEMPASASSHPVPMPGVIALLRFGLQVTQRKWKEIFILAIVSAAPSFLFLLIPTQGGFATTMLTLVVAFISFLATTAVLFIIIKHAEQIRSTDALQWAFRNFFSIVWISILATLISLTGLMLLIIPAIAFGIFTLFSFIVFVREDARGVRALLRSTDLVRGAFWGVFGRIFLITLIFFGIGMVAGIVTSSVKGVPIAEEAVYFAITLMQVVLSAISLGAFVSLYEARREAKPLFDISSYTTLAWVYRVAAVLGVVFFVVALFAAASYISTFFSQFSEEELMQWEAGVLEEDTEGFNFDDFLTQSNVEATAVSADLYGGRMGSYEGVCNDITVVAPIQCAETLETFAIFAPLSDGQYHCVDSAGFSGPVGSPLRESALCQ